jgi:hypothetical protein
MILTPKQFSLLSAFSAQGFRRRLHEHIRAHAADPRLDVEMFAARAIELGEHRNLRTEDDIAALTEVLLAVRRGELGQGIPDWLEAILADCVPGRARRLRQCLAIERRIAAQEARHG